MRRATGVGLVALLLVLSSACGAPALPAGTRAPSAAVTPAPSSTPVTAPSPTATGTWTPATVEGAGTAAVAGWELRDVVIWNGGYLAIAVGASGSGEDASATWWSDDGSAWAPLLRTDGIRTLQGRPLDVARIEAVTVFEPAGLAPRLLAVGAAPLGATSSEATVFSSFDGLTWIAAPFPEPEATLAWIESSPSVIVAGGGLGGDAAIWWSEDGERWRRADLPGGEGWVGAQDAAPALVRTVASSTEGGRDRWVAVGEVPPSGGSGFMRAVAWSSADGRTWTRAGDLPGVEGAAASDSVSYDDPGRFVAVGASGAGDSPLAWESPDEGATWTSLPVPREPGSMDRVALTGDGRLTAIGIVNLAEVFETPVSGVGWAVRDSGWTRVPLEGVIPGVPWDLASRGVGDVVVVGRGWPRGGGTWDAPYEPGAWIWTLPDR